MSNEESLLERILKPVRINPVTLGLSFTGVSISLLFDPKQDTSNLLLAIFSGSIIGGGFFGCYIYSGINYFRDRKILKRYGFDNSHGKRRVSKYCSRQAFYVACIENGYREEVSKFIEETPNKDKAFWYLPHC